MTVNKSRALMAALALAASPLALSLAHAQDREVNTEQGGANRAQPRASSQPAKPAAAAAAGTISAEVGKPLNQVVTAMAAKKYPDALAAAKTAQGLAKTDYEKMKVNQFLTTININMGDEAAADVAAEAAADTPPDAIPADEKQTIYYNAAALALNNKHTDKALAYAKQLQAINAMDARSQDVIGRAYYASGDPAAVAFFQKQIDAVTATGKAPSRDQLMMLMAAQIKAKDEPGAEKTMVQQVLYFNDKQDWKQIIDVTISTRGIRDIDAVMLGRLLFASGADVSKEDADLIGQTTQKMALYGDAQTAQSKGATLQMDPARVASDKAALPQQITMGAGQSGLFNIKLAEALYGYGMYAQAETAARTAQTKGGADASEVTMLIGLSQIMQAKYADGIATLGQVSGGGPVTPRVAELWIAFAKNKGGLVPGGQTASR